MRYPCAALLLVFLVGCAGDPGDQPSSHPNVLLILADDQGWGDLSVHGNTNLSTPNIDSIAHQGALFENFYVSAVCSPTRAEILTGRYHPRGGVHGTSAGSERLDLDERTMAEAFQAAGYATGAFGKWHNGSQSPYHPNDRGFGEFYGFTSGHWAQYFNPPLDHNGEIVRGNGFLADDLTDHAIAFIEEHREGPFFTYVPYNTPHSPMQVPDRFFEKFDGYVPGMQNRDPENEDLPHLRAALAMVENLDWNVGRMLTRLDELGLAENTIVIYMSDNGPNGWRWNGDMKGRKGSIDEGGLRAPALFRWKGRIPAGRKIDRIAGAIDLLPTLTQMADIPVVGDKPLDGLSLRPLLMDEAQGWPDRELFTFWNGRVGVRTQQYRLDGEGRLFDIAADRGQRVDLANERPDERSKLQADVDAMTAEMGDYTADDRPLPVGHKDFTWLPARDATTRGGVERSSRHPNSSYFSNWKRPDDAIVWAVEVEREGTYEVEAYYACPPADVGATVEVDFLGATMTATIDEAYDPPLIGEADDRFPRQEGYTKDFRPFSLGTMKLAQGRGELLLRATRVPGSQAMELSAVTLRLND
ncbi:MAG: arylsulfatase [Acidobacteria bacterium]|nr:arylsulfatase [Acidobacteriota bacterium]MDA1233690.1 arylsulfatase [Acidobacteriota bacterium]